MFRIDLASDTKSLPVPAMMQAIAEAELGDEQEHACPTTNRLLARVCDLLGTEDAVFLPSGTMANQIAVLVHCRPGDELIAHETAHLVAVEAGAAAALAGTSVRALGGARGLFSAADVERAVRRRSRQTPRSRLVVVEQTTNIAGGEIWPLEQLREIVDVSRAHGLATHLDGARLFNAVVKTDISAKDYASGFDTVYLDFTKGLGCPVGAVLAGGKAEIEAAWRWKQRLGGAMRQTGVLTAACLWALDNHIARLAEDNANADALADALGGIDGLSVEPVSSNIVFFDVADSPLRAPDLIDRLKPFGARAGATTDTRVRCVTHLGVDRAGVLEFARLVRDCLASP